MPENDQHDPWASLADSLGATPSKEPERPAAARPQPPAQTPRQQSRPKPTAASGDWDQLASELGVSGGGESAPPPRRPAPPPPPAGRPTSAGGDEPRGDRRRDDRPPRRFDEERPARRDELRRDEDRRDDDRPAGESRGEIRPEGREAGDQSGDRDEGRGRRRRGRRGGRGRGRREGDRVGGEGEAGARRGDGPGDDVQPRDDRGPSRHRPESDRTGAAWGDEAPRGEDGVQDRDERRAEPAAGGDGREGGPPRADDRNDEDRPRRRRRGRRGGRGRGRSTESGTDRAEQTGDRSGSRESAARGGDELDDEPLPTSYGMRPAAPRPESDRGERPAEPRGTDEGGGRRRRRRRGGEGRSRGERESSGSREPAQGRSRSRGSRRTTGESRSSSFSRGRRDDFAPVAGRHDEDDEGLEFLGVEEAGQEPRRQAPEDEDILVESGLNTVLDVPSWVEAIGIVIAGNLDARNKGRGGDRGR